METQTTECIPHALDIDNILRANGIDVLTGEADGTNMSRLLCDVSEHGLSIINKFFGCKIQTGNNWNSGVASIMLTRIALQEIAIFIKLTENCICLKAYDRHYKKERCYYFNSNDLNAIKQDKRLNLMVDMETAWFYYANGTAGTRNVHVMSGRIE